MLFEDNFADRICLTGNIFYDAPSTAVFEVHAHPKLNWASRYWLILDTESLFEGLGVP